MKTVSLPPQNSSQKQLQEPTHGFIRAYSPCRLKNSKGKQSRCRRNHHQNCLQSRRMDSSAHTAPVDSQIVKENGVDAEEIITETACRADFWIRQGTRPLFTQKYSRKTESPPPTKSSPKLLSELTLGFVSAHRPC